MSKKLIKLPHESAKEKIARQHDLGVNLANSGIELINKNRNNARSDVDSYKLEYDHWYDITSEILNEIFVSTEYSIKFKELRSSKVEYVSSSWQPDIKYYLAKEIQPKIKYLKLLVENILTFDVDTDEHEEVKVTIPTPDNNGSLREKVENNPIAWLFSMLLAGYLAGLGTYQGILEIAKLDVVSEKELKDLRSAQIAPTEREQSIGDNLGPNISKQIEVLTTAHHQRLSELQKQLLEAEKGASDNSNIDSNKKSHRESALRIEQLISNEHKSYNENLKALRMLK